MRVSWHSRIRRLWRALELRAGDPALIEAQSTSLPWLVPILYLVGLASSAILAAGFYRWAPMPLSIGMGGALSAFCAARLIHWGTGRPLREIRRLPLRMAAFPLVYSGWAVALFPYGGAFARALAVLVVLVMLVTSMFCLGSIRRAALLGGAVAGGVLALFLVLQGSAMMGLYIVAVTVAMICVAELQNRDFRRNVEALRLAAEAQRRSEMLAQENVELANLDYLTRLPNRRAFFHRLGEVATGTDSLAVGIIDLDGFKPVNDLYGHGIGDRLLAEVGQRLGAIAATQGFFIARLGGDEFAFILENPADGDALAARGNAICQVLGAPYMFDETTIQISASAGIAVYPLFAPNPGQLFERADYALYHAKAVRRGSAELFSSGHEAQLNDNALIEQTLMTADLAAELVVEFQPIVETRRNRVLGFEALARWDSATLGRVGPVRFIPVAERAGIVGQITQPLLRKALAAASTWPEDIRLSFNLSAHDLNSPESILALIGIIDRSDFDPYRIDLEITETAFVRDFRHVQRSTEMLRLLGCGISLDDFGTGYSSLSRLHDLPLTKIKIDRSFIADLDRSPASYKIVKSLLTLGQDMGLECVIEGVETEREMALLEKLGGRIVQGFYYSQPIPAEQVAAYLLRHAQGLDEAAWLRSVG